MAQSASATRLRGAPCPQLRRMTNGDVPVVARLERACFQNPWSEQAFLAEVGREGSVPLVAVEGGEVVAYGIAWIVADEFHVVNVAVKPSHRRRGIAVALINALIEEARTRGARLATLEVRSRNEVAVRLYRSFGFEPVAVRRHYYHNPLDDALVMLRSLEAAPHKDDTP